VSAFQPKTSSADGIGKCTVVRRNQCSAAVPLAGFDQSDEGGNSLHVQSVGGLVCNQQPWIANERRAEVHAPSLPQR
jgi:hypothetical protein